MLLVFSSAVRNDTVCGLKLREEGRRSLEAPPRKPLEKIWGMQECCDWSRVIKEEPPEKGTR
ncbi:hypothetical protein N7539_002219 [Penicillium diatomitis]|uniref:Uncharacterized protein n=1 Tax=Penicillium diatomitis TaxID=2819901 RepID=A0A9W9XI80_9EURO|nr:uncharacterized protein N7539_002219 [Penicillium diatomitis]KAJ5493473.1 hypothetical protein N7539_002219 [Penicillium diatomitis]